MRGTLDQFRLGVRRPNDRARPVTVAEAGPIEYDYPVFFGDQIEQSAGYEILNHAPVAVQQNYGVARSTFDVMKPHAVHVDEPARRRVLSLGLFASSRLTQAIAVPNTIADAATLGDPSSPRRQDERERRLLFLDGIMDITR